jgi:hypothetical protein
MSELDKAELSEPYSSYISFSKRLLFLSLLFCLFSLADISFVFALAFSASPTFSSLF